MILATVGLKSWANLELNYSGIDSPDQCRDSRLFNQWPEPIVYHYNSRGFRDVDWPEDLQNAVWCIGDSFTVGLGVNFAQTWCQQIQQQLGIRVVNISMDGASNNWIARQACAVLQEIQPLRVICHWSYSHRRERALEQILTPIWQEYYNAIRDPAWPDCRTPEMVATLPLEVQNSIAQDPRATCWHSDFDLDYLRRLHYDTDKTVNAVQDLANTMQCIQQVNAIDSTVIHSFIPGWHPQQECTKQIDFARDGFHYGPRTHQRLAQRLLEILEV